MRFYRVTIDGSTDNTRFEPTFKGARVLVRALYMPWKDMTYIDEVEVDTSKDGVTALIRGNPPIVTEVLRSWSITERGGVKEVERVAA